MGKRFEGLVAAPYTAMHADGNVNLDRIEQQAEALLRDGVRAAFVCGTTGEGMSLSVEERLAVAKRWTEVAGKDLDVIVHVGHNALTDCKTLAAHAKKVRAAAVAAMAPPFFKPSCVGDLVTFCRDISAAAAGVPFYYYHIPSMTGVSFAMADFLEAAADRIPDLAGIKYTYEDLMDFERCRMIDDGRFDMLFGRDELLLCGLALGARGAVGSTYNFAAPIYHKLIAAFNAGDLATARQQQRYSIELITLIARFAGSFLPTAKTLMQFIGVDCGPVRPPLRNLTPEQREALRTQLEETGLLAIARGE
ncbi:MAG: dihydrodipicolinate synthase family protein [Phycisphaerae bacterium]|nr:dihydrodipicolinate synthase family protein [Phycisphaerae bacterium]